MVAAPRVVVEERLVVRGRAGVSGWGVHTAIRAVMALI